MSRKLEALAQQLVAMGFSQDRATMALILNEGKVEESVAWHFEGAEEAVKHEESTIGSGNLKIDISEELARIADMEIRFKCSRQEVERAIVAAEGDLDSAAEALSTLKLDLPTPKTEESGDPLSTNKVAMAASQNLSVGPQPKPNPTPPTQQRIDERDFNYTEAAVTGGGPSESTSKSFQSLKRILPKIEWAKPQQSAVPADKRWPSSGSNPSVSYSLASPLQASPSSAKAESHYVAVGNDFKNFQPSNMEPVMMMQPPQLLNPNQVPATSASSPGTTSFMYPISSVEILKSNGFMPHIPSARSLGSNGLSSSQKHHQLYYPQQQQFTSGSDPGESPQISRGNGLWSSRTGASPMLAPASSLGLFTGLNSTTTSGATSLVDWTRSSSMEQLDYTNIDWSLDGGLSSSPTLAGIWPGPTSSVSTSHIYHPNSNRLRAKPAMRFTPSNGGVAPTESSTVALHEWTSPFEGNDLFSLPKQFVSSPSPLVREQIL
ncbi:putative Armadillo repeat-containing protein [Hibiscus syriacus]|uniref:Armadillo repeat-containing protein n=1 Tax=Hibiscus syriacus TaxID=106335 RepID=A0A6A2ZI11_HIBSY|nr:putative Armadillo repeat-containing protein [Hibiscus syriacus]